MNFGKLDRLVTIQAPVVTISDGGAEKTIWSDVATVWGQKKDMSVSSKLTADRELEEETTVFRIRYRSDVTAEHRLVCEGKTYRIAGGPIEWGRKEALEITGVAVLP